MNHFTFLVEQLAAMKAQIPAVWLSKQLENMCLMQLWGINFYVPNPMHLD